MSFISSAVYFGETSVAFGGYSTVQMELTVELWVRVLQTPKANSCISEWFSKPLSCHEFRVCKGREGPVFLQRASQFSIFFGEPLNQPTNPHCPLFVCYTNTNLEFFANFNFSMPQLPSGLGCCSGAVADWVGSCWTQPSANPPKSRGKPRAAPASPQRVSGSERFCHIRACSRL